MIQKLNSAFLPDQSVLNFWSSAQLLHVRTAANVSPAYAATLPRPVYVRSFWVSEEVYQTSHNRYHDITDGSLSSAIDGQAHVQKILIY